MYRHLLVPIDDTDLSVDVVGNAVAFARALSARITFFHAVHDASADLLHDDAELLRVTGHAALASAAVRKAGELLAKAAAAARALGVPCGLRQAIGDHPAQAVMDAARDAGCDLIFMASHGHRNKLGMAFSSETLAVLMDSGLPVLVSSTGELPPRARAIAIIRDEHRAIAAVMHAGLQALSDARHDHVDVSQLRAMVDYLQRFAQQVHHPKEESQLFSRLRARTTSCHAELDELERQHARDAALMASLSQQVDALAAADGDARPGALVTLQQEVSRYADFLWDHLGREEGVILPAAQRHLQADDWKAIDAAFAQERDADGGRGEPLRALFARIVDPSVT